MDKSAELKRIAKRCAFACLVSAFIAYVLWWQPAGPWLAVVPIAIGLFFAWAAIAATFAERRLQAPVEPIARGVAPAVLADMDRQISRWVKGINDFGAVVERSPMSVLPEAALPLPKADMKEAFRFAWFANPQARSILEVGFIQLAHFQPGIDTPIRLDLQADPNASPQETVQAGFDWNERTKDIRPLVEAEESRLFVELAAMKTGPPPFAQHMA